ncbi:acetolactate synthase small subunit [Myroides profundi]|uniref:Acetolactate synthase small subunit n=1 Tax=Myroides profundi TaxID=480520 RepID=A0AAJ4W6L9_MYRPR|nr:acetolactate synthase small subunit [Myroides profundi]SER52276.1 acetolactate synthase, small subunit [Myroides profundi]
MKEEFTLSVFTENSIGMLTRITNVFTRRHINLDSLTVSESEVKQVFKYTVVFKSTQEQVDKLIGQLERLVEVFKVFAHKNSDIIYQELALYKVKTNLLSNTQVEQIIRESQARILSVDKDFIAIEKTGYIEEIENLFTQLSNYGVLEFTRSGRVAITKPMKYEELPLIRN